MGIISSKLLKHDSNPSKISTAIQTDTPKQTPISDVRSPTADIVRTPIIVEKLKPEMDSPPDYKSLPLRNKLLKNLKLDPRSPTIGIYRTPILIEDTPSNKASPSNFDSPVSIYSSNANDYLDEVIMTPIEPSMNVSGFEFPKEIYSEEVDLTMKQEEIKTIKGNRNSLKVLDKPNTDEAKKLLDEIMSDEENFLVKVKMPLKKSKMPSIKSSGKNSTEGRGKFRPPLSNITSSSNSPGNVNAGLKLLSRNKVLPEFGSENSTSLNVKQVAQWDQNNTVII